MTTSFDNKYSVATLTDKVSNITYEFPFNINSLNWVYQMNTQSYSTIGGRVTQLLSVKISTLTLQGEAGSRERLIRLYENFKRVQDNQNTSKKSMTLHVPSQGLQWNVFLERMQMSWDVTTVTYPYSMLFEVDQDLSQTTTSVSAADALNRISQGIGFNSDWLGLTTNSVNLQFSSTSSDGAV